MNDSWVQLYVYKLSGSLIYNKDSCFSPVLEHWTSVPDSSSCGVLTVWTLLAAGLQQQFGDGRVVGHDGDVERRQALTVGGVQVQLVC